MCSSRDGAESRQQTSISKPHGVSQAGGGVPRTQDGSVQWRLGWAAAGPDRWSAEGSFQGPGQVAAPSRTRRRRISRAGRICGCFSVKGTFVPDPCCRGAWPASVGATLAAPPPPVPIAWLSVVLRALPALPRCPAVAERPPTPSGAPKLLPTLGWCLAFLVHALWPTGACLDKGQCAFWGDPCLSLVAACTFVCHEQGSKVLG